MPNLAHARARVNTTLTDSCTITADPEGYYDDSFDTGTGELTPSATSIVYTGMCSVRTPVGSAVSVEIGGQLLTRLRYTLTLPEAGTESVTVGQTVTIDTSSDSSLTGKTFIVRHVIQGAWEPSRRCEIEDRTSGEQAL